MKKLLSIFAITVILVGCSKGDDPQPKPETDSITITSGSSITLQSEESTGTITISSNVSWKASATESWVELSPTSGAAGNSSITVKVKENESTDERNASVTITGGKASASVTIAQKQKDALLLSTNKIEIGGEGGEFEVEVKSNVTVQHTIDVDWIKLVSTKAMTTSKLTFAVEESDEKEKREGTIKFTAGNLKEEVKVYQAEGGDIFVLSHKEYELTKEEQEIKIELRSNIGFSTIEIPKDVDWITEVQTKASSTYTKYLLISENNTYDDRAAKVDIFNGDKSRKETIAIWQSQTDSLGVVKSEYDVAPEGEVIEIDVHHNVKFTVKIPETCQGWIRILETKGIESSNVQIEVAENDGKVAREGVLSIKGDEIDRTVLIRQNPVHTKILYTSTDGEIIEPLHNRINAWDISGEELRFTNTYSSEGGIIEFDGKVHTMECPIFMGSQLLTFQGISNNVFLKDNPTEWLSLITGETWSMNDMFDGCTALTKVDFSNFNTKNLTNARKMFNGCASLTELILGEFNTDNMTNMKRMFYGCSSLESLDVRNFNTVNVTDMEGLFCRCSSLTSLDVSKFNTENVTDMNSLFEECSLLTTLEVGGFDTRNVTNMKKMFYGCSSLESLDVRNFNTVNVTDMEGLFFRCSSLTSLDVSKFNTENVTDMSEMFFRCSSLTSLDVSNFNTENVTDMGSVFAGCSSVESLDVGNFNTENATIMWQMFNGCSSLESLDISIFNTENVTEMSGMFDGCSSLKTLDLSRFRTENVTDMGRMFYGCSSLESLDMSSFNTENVINMYDMFTYCRSLKELDLCGFYTGNVTRMNCMFEGCSSLESLDISNFNTENVTDMEQMFRDCSSLQKLKVGVETNKGVMGPRMFDGVGNYGLLFYPQGSDYSEWLNESNLGAYGWTGRTY